MRLEAFHKKNLVKAKEDIMLMLQRMMNHPEKRSRYESEDSSSKALTGLKKNLLSISAFMQKEYGLHP